VLFWLWPARQARSDNFVIYLPNAHRLMPIQIVDNTRYLPLIKVLNLVGTATSLEEKRGSLRVGVGDDRLELRDGNKKLKLNRHDISLSSPVRVEGGEWLVPLDFLDSVLPRLTTETVRYRAGDERLFLGDVKPLTFSAHLNPSANGDRLSVLFTAPVTVKTASTNGQWVIFLGDEALMPLEQEMKFQSRFISSMRFDDQDGAPKLIITPAGATLNFYPSLADGGKTLQVDVTQAAAPPAQTAAAPPSSTGAPAAAPPPAGSAQPAAASNVPPAPASAPAPAPPPLPVVVLDPGHGGADAGGHSSDGVTERDLMAALAERVRSALTSTGKVRVVLTRTGSSDPNLDDRDSLTNMAHPVAFVTLHAGDLGGASPAIAVYTYQAPSAPGLSAAPRTFFVPWDEAQQAQLTRSRDFAGLVAQQFGHVQGLEVRGPTAAPVRQLRSVDAPALALELGTLAPRQEAAALTAASFQDQLANAIAQAVLALTQGAS
jgi:N-acetylmuramoyl-L-alanine amidase